MTMTVADTILEQLGGNKFQIMTGAKLFVGSSEALQFRIPNSNGINCISIQLNPLDLYDFTFYSIRGVKVTIKDQVDNIDATQLREVFTKFTGLETSLGTMGR